VGHVRILGIAFSILVGTGCFAASAHAAPPEGKGQSHDGSGPAVIADQTVAEAVGQLIHPDINYDEVRRIAIDHHYTGYRALPPGIAKNLARGKPLPPGIAKKSAPSRIVRELPTYPDYEWKRCGTDLVLVHIATQIVAEVLANIFK